VHPWVFSYHLEVTTYTYTQGSSVTEEQHGGVALPLSLAQCCLLHRLFAYIYIYILCRFPL
jgi:hypothetical protein